MNDTAELNVPRPGGAMARRELHFIWLLDTSGSMNSDGKIQALNVAIREAIPHLVSAARDNPNVDVRVRAMTFSDGARWHIETPTPVHDLKWIDVAAGGHTDTGTALKLLAQALKVPPMPERAVSPVLVLVTDGHHTDDFEAGLAALLAERWGREAVRMAIAIGRDVHLASLQQFIGNDEIRPVEASHPEALVQQIRWVSRSGIDSVSQVLDGGRRLTVGDLANNSAGTVDDAVEW
ncbi:MAG: VWA domain-containing protein [Rhizobacter sp.]|nr:VWA domain-containing protein [Rhizobacter sp.]MBP6267999.1 VWA domain-containing protein [Rhizobacter sp.]HOX66340.1 vWA domain-containing protein [Burkholderiaceae bacterium]